MRSVVMKCLSKMTALCVMAAFFSQLHACGSASEISDSNIVANQAQEESPTATTDESSDENGESIEEGNVYLYKTVADNEIDVTTSYYNKNGKVVSLSTSRSIFNSSSVTKTFTYDDRDNLLTEYVESKSYISPESDDFNLYPSFTKYTYDIRNNLLFKGIDVDNDGVYEYITNYTYNLSNKPLTIIDERFTVNPPVKHITEYEYDESGLLEIGSRVHVEGNSFEITTVSKYNSNNDIISHEEFYDGKRNLLVSYKYSSEGKLFSVLYSYDKNGDFNDKVEYYYYNNDGYLTYFSTQMQGNTLIREIEYQSVPEIYVSKGIATSEIMPHIEEVNSLHSHHSYNYDYAPDGSEFRIEHSTFRGYVTNSSIIIHRYDKHTNEIEYIEDHDNNGVYEVHTVTENFYKLIEE